MAITFFLAYFFQKICKMLETSLWDYEKLSVVTYKIK